MATENFFPDRPNAAVNYLSTAKVLKCTIEECETLQQTTPAAAASLPSLGAVQEYAQRVSGADVNMICGGTIARIGSTDTFGILANDTKAATTGLYIVRAPRVFLALDAGATVTQGAPAYIIVATGLITDAAGAGANKKVGIFIDSALTALTTSDGYPATNYARLTWLPNA